MRLPRTPRFERETATFGLCYQCDDCAHFMVDSGRCAHEWPVGDHRPGDAEVSPGELVFCKEFDLL